MDPESFIVPGYLITNSVRNAYPDFSPLADKGALTWTEIGESENYRKIQKMTIRTQNKYGHEFCLELHDDNCYVVQMRSIHRTSNITYYEYIMKDGTYYYWATHQKLLYKGMLRAGTDDTVKVVFPERYIITTVDASDPSMAQFENPLLSTN